MFIIIFLSYFNNPKIEKDSWNSEFRSDSIGGYKNSIIKMKPSNSLFGYKNNK